MAPPIDLSRRASNLHDMMHDNHAKLLNECPDDWLASLRETFATLLEWQEEQTPRGIDALSSSTLKSMLLAMEVPWEAISSWVLFFDSGGVDMEACAPAPFCASSVFCPSDPYPRRGSKIAVKEGMHSLSLCACGVCVCDNGIRKNLVGRQLPGHAVTSTNGSLAHFHDRREDTNVRQNVWGVCPTILRVLSSAHSSHIICY